MIGDSVNLAARLMRAAQGRCLTDTATYLEARIKCTFEHLPPIKVKGKEKPIAVFAATEQIVESDQSGVPLSQGTSHTKRTILETRSNETTLYGRFSHVQWQGWDSNLRGHRPANLSRPAVCATLSLPCLRLKFVWFQRTRFESCWCGFG